MEKRGLLAADIGCGEGSTPDILSILSRYYWRDSGIEPLEF